MIKFNIIILALLLISRSVLGQMEVTVKKSDFRIKQTGFRAAWMHIQEGDIFAQKGTGALGLALAEYLKAYEYNPENAALNYKIGSCLLKSNNKKDAIIYLQKAYIANSKIVPDIHFMLAKAFQQSYQFDDAVKEYELYYQSLPRKLKKNIGPLILKYKEECLNAKELVATPKRMIIKDLGDSVNSVYDDYNSIISANDSMMYFISRRPAFSGERPSEADSRFNEDIYIASNDSGKWEKTARLHEKFNNKHHTAIVWISSDNKTMFLYNGHKNNGDLQYSKFKNGKWTKPSRLKGGFNTDEKETSITMTADEKEVFFVSADARESFGGKDIFYSVKNDRGKWTSPKNIGSAVNTIYNEEGVYVQPDGKTLYFSSQGHNSMGGFDIFKVTRDEKNVWSKAQNLGYPLNTPDDELFFRPDKNEKLAYFSASRPESKGGMDIFKVILLGADKQMILMSEDQLISYQDHPYSDIFANIPKEITVDTSFLLKGTITDAKTQSPIQAKINLIDLERSQVIATTISQENGDYTLILPSLKNFGIEINSKDYLFLLDVLNIQKVYGQEIVKNFTLSKLEVGAKVILKNIYFETGKATLKEESFAELDKVLKFLQENTDLKIEISGHTDNVGTLKANTLLSEARAKSVVQYFSNHGVLSDRLVYKGYAFSQPISPNTTPAGRKMNRRVEFKIVGKE